MTWAGEGGAQGSGIYIFSDDGSPGIITGEQGELIQWGSSGPTFVEAASLTGVRGIPVGATVGPGADFAKLGAAISGGFTTLHVIGDSTATFITCFV